MAEGPQPRLILASASPRRREILERLGIDFEVSVPDAPELGEGPADAVVVENARRKARAGLSAAGRPGAVALGVDTEVVLDGRIFGKAADEATAREHLRALSGRVHEVLSGVVLLWPGHADAVSAESDEAGEAVRIRERAGVAVSRVTFRELDGDLLELYLGSGEWRDRAGAYAIQGLGSILVERLEGDFSNVVGLPVGLLLDLAPELFSTR